MNRVQLVQVIVMLTAMFSAFYCITYLIFFISNGISYIAGIHKFLATYTLSYGVIMILFAIVFFLSIKYINNISVWIIEKVQLDENINLKLSDKSTLYAVLLYLTLGSILKNTPYLFYKLIQALRYGTYEFIAADDTKKFSFAFNGYTSLIEVVFSFILLVKAKAIVDYLHNKINSEDPHTISDVDNNGTSAATKN